MTGCKLPSTWINCSSLALLFISLLTGPVLSQAQPPGRVDAGMFSIIQARSQAAG